MMFDLQQQIRPNIRRLEPYSSARDEFKGTGRIMLDANESPFDTGYNRYPDPFQQELKDRVAELFNTDPGHLFLGNGSDEAIDLLIRIFCEPYNEGILICPPTYGMYQVAADVHGSFVRKVLLTSNFKVQVEPLLESLKGIKLIFLCSPNNPTGNDMDPEDVEAILERSDGVVVIDEAYGDFAGRASYIEWLDRYPNLVVLRTLSKAWGLAGIRLGVAAASRELISVMNKVKPPYNVGRPVAEVALKALDDEEAHDKRVARTLQERARMEKGLQEHGLVEKVHPSDANFLLVRFKDAKKVYEELREKGIVVRDRSGLPHCEGCLRITIGTPEENRVLLKALEAMITERT